jgi:hypothetical protein
MPTLPFVTDDIPETVASLTRPAGADDVFRAAERRLALGDAAFLADLGIALTAARGSGALPAERYRSVFRHLLRLLATAPGPGNITQALRLVSAAPAAGREQGRYAASLLASSHPAEALAVAFTGHATEDVRACLVHELVLRGADITEVPAIARWAASPHRRHHPLGRLPLTLSALEGRPPLPGHGDRGDVRTRPYHSPPYDPEASRRSGTRTGAPPPPARETTTEVAAREIGAAVANWGEDSNGLIEARVFDLAAPPEPGSMRKLLPALGLECLEGAGRRTALSAAACPPDRVWQTLFAAAATGGAYGPGSHGAHGRLAAWRSLAGLCGADPGASVEETEARARECSWYAFDADTPWFVRVAWDIGLVAVGPEGRLAVLAATDTD